MSVVQSMPTAWAPQSAITGSHWPPPLVKHDHRDRSALGLPRQARDDALHVLERELLVGRGAQAAAPGVEDLHGLGAGGYLRLR
jgi:hypothetical protein